MQYFEMFITLYGGPEASDHTLQILYCPVVARMSIVGRAESIGK
jgi:hypothetical protein